MYETIHEEKEERLDLLLVFVVLSFLAINGAWKMYINAYNEGSFTYEIRESIRAERDKFENVTVIDKNLGRYDNTIAYYGVIDRMCLSLPGGAGINYMYNMHIDDRIKYAVVRTEGIDYIELIDNLEQEYDIVFQDEYFVFMEKH